MRLHIARERSGAAGENAHMGYASYAARIRSTRHTPRTRTQFVTLRALYSSTSSTMSWSSLMNSNMASDRISVGMP